jgi:hypothetical protein
MQECVSEVARLRQAINDECEALQRICLGFAVVASHEVIHHKYEAIDQHRAKLALHLGDEQAINEAVETYTRVVIGKTPHQQVMGDTCSV